jgi:hypothetical protein
LKEALEQIIYARLEAYRANGDLDSAESAIHFLRLAEQLGVALGLWRLQNLFWELVKTPAGLTRETSSLMRELAEKLKFSERLVAS